LRLAGAELRGKQKESALPLARRIGVIMANINKFLDKSFETMEFAELVKAPVDALAGISQGDAAALATALNIKTIGDLATNKYVLWAQAIHALSN
jgi:hypothetical protein